MALRSEVSQLRFDDADRVFEARLDALGLGEDAIREQSLVELHDSLEQIEAAIAKPEAFGVLSVAFTANAGKLTTLVTTGTAESHITYGILPLLLVVLC